MPTVSQLGTLDLQFHCSRKPRSYTKINCLEDRVQEKNDTKECIKCGKKRPNRQFTIGYDYSDPDDKTSVCGIYRGNKCNPCRGEKMCDGQESEIAQSEKIKELEEIIQKLDVVLQKKTSLIKKMLEGIIEACDLDVSPDGSVRKRSNIPGRILSL